MSYDATILADSLSPDGVRLTTLKVTFPRFILAEVNTHRMLSRNSASSRAIPTEKLIDRVREVPFIPETFNKRVKGMGVGDPLEEGAAEASRAAWLDAAEWACQGAERLLNLDVDKSRANRLLEPFLWHTAIISATEWDNFFALRDHEAAQPEFRITAQLMRKAMEDSQPQQLLYGDWHLPMISDDELAELAADHHLLTMFKMVSAGRVARVSYDTHDNFETRQKSYERAEILMGNGHFSPFEHVARPMGEPSLGHLRPEYAFMGNFRGWVQFRKEIPHEENFALVGHPEVTA